MNEHEFGYQIRSALDESLQNLSPKVARRLAHARQSAVNTLPKTRFAVSYEPVLTSSAGTSQRNKSESLFVGQFGMLIPTVVLLLALFWAWQWGESERAFELADEDVELLTDDLPLEAHVDRGFSVFLKEAQ